VTFMSSMMILLVQIMAAYLPATMVSQPLKHVVTEVVGHLNFPHSLQLRV